MSRFRAVLVAALVAVAIVPIAGAQADKGGDHGGPATATARSTSTR